MTYERSILLRPASVPASVTLDRSISFKAARSPASLTSVKVIALVQAVPLYLYRLLSVVRKKTSPAEALEGSVDPICTGLTSDWKLSLDTDASANCVEPTASAAICVEVTPLAAMIKLPLPSVSKVTPSI